MQPEKSIDIRISFSGDMRVDADLGGRVSIVARIAQPQPESVELSSRLGGTDDA